MVLTRLLLSGLLFTACLTQESHAQEDEDQECLEGQWILSVNEIPGLRARAVDAIREVSSGRLEVASSTARALLLTPPEQVQIAYRRLHARSVSYHPRNNLCMRMRDSARQELRRQRVSNKASLLRRFSCSCNGKVSLAAIPNDPSLYLQWALNQSNDVDMNLPEAWNLYTGSSTTVVAVIDTGIDYTHPDLAANIWINEADPPNGIDDDNNGYVDDRHGYNALARNGNPMDDHGHGTHVSGTIGAATNNGLGVAGVNWDVKIMGCKFLSSGGWGSIYDAMLCVDYVTTMKNRGVNVILSNNSWGGGGFYQPFYDALLRARSAGILFVAAAGNNSNNNDSNPYYPCGYGVDNVISVASVDSSGNLSYFSNYGASSVHIGAPGSGILSTLPGARYASWSGTSMATPHISGALALLYSYAPYLTWQELKANLLATGKNLNSLAGRTTTGKMADAYAMLQAVGTPDPSRPTPTPRPTATSTPTPVPTSTPTPVFTPTRTPTPVPGYWSLSSVVTINGTPLSGVKVRLNRSNSSEVLYRYTNSEGRAIFDNVLGPCHYELQATASGFSISTHAGYLQNDTEVQQQGTALPYALTVKVLSQNMQPVSGVRINAGDQVRWTDSAGKTVILTEYASSYSITASLEGYTFNVPSLSGTVYGAVERVLVALPADQ